MPFDGPDVLRLTTLRSFDQFNTTIYGDHDVFRGIHGTRRILMMNEADIARLGLREGALVPLWHRAKGSRVPGYK
jgi:anaerobic selenocysteine-containing dehydrogenase